MSNNNNQLTEDQKKQQAAVPAATPTASGSDSPYANYLTQNAKAPVVSAGGDEYSKWLETLAKNKEIENTPQNAKTYTEYLVYTGQDPVGDYNAKRRQADLDYRKSLATFGQNAEKMAQAGMTGSGYSDYLTGQAYAQRANTMQAAQRDANTQMKQSFANYGEYVAGLQAQQEQAKTVDNVELTNAMSMVSTMLGNGANIDAVIASLNGAYSADVLEQVKQNLQAGNDLQYTSDIQYATGVRNYKTALDQQLAQGTITPDAYKQQLQKGYKKNYEFVTKALNGDNSGLAEYAKAAGLDISAGSDEQIDAVIDHMAQNGAITGAQRNQYYTSLELQSISDNDYTSKDAVNEVVEIQKLLDSGKISSEQQRQLLSALGAKVDEMAGGEVTEAKASIGASAWKITYRQGKYGKETISIDPTDMEPHDGTGFVAGQEIPTGYTALGAKTGITFGTVNGQLALRISINTTQGTVYKYFTDIGDGYVNTKHNAAFVAWALTHGETQQTDGVQGANSSSGSANANRTTTMAQ